MRLRRLRRSDDVEPLDTLFELIAECDGHRPIGEHKYLDLIHGDPERATGIVGEEAGAIVAYAAISDPASDGTGALELAIHPLHRSDVVVRTILEAAIDRVRDLGASRVRMWAFHPHLVGILESIGFEPERELRQLRRPLPVQEPAVFPSAVDIRPFVKGRDEEPWLTVNNAAFAGHPENGWWTEDVLRDRQEQPWFDSDGFRMAWDDGTLVGFCWTKLHGAGVGEIYVVAVAPRHQGRGLGRALVLEGLRYLSEDQKATAAMLYVDADNGGAISLYERLGFRLDHVDRSLIKPLRD